MKLNKFFLLGLASLAFAACSSDDENVASPENNLDSKFRVTLSLGKTASGRSLGVTADGQYNIIEKLQFVFFDGNGKYVAYPLKGSLNGNAYDNGDAISKAVTVLNDKRTATVELKEIPGTAKQLLIIANNKDSKGQGSINTATLELARKSMINLSDQQIANFTVFSGEKSTLSGLDNQFEEVKRDKETVYRANVDLRPVPSRIELGNISAKAVPENEGWTGPEVEKFVVLGYYVNNFYTTGALDATLESTQRVKIDKGSDVNNYTAAAYDNLKFMCDEPTEGQINYATGTNGVVWQGTTVDDKFWGYQILKGEVAHIVVKLKVDFAAKGDIEAQKGVIKFLTINRYKYASAPGDGAQAGDVVNYMQRGHVYKVNNISFDAGDLTDAPYEVSKAIEAVVTVKPWVGVPVTPEFQ